MIANITGSHNHTIALETLYAPVVSISRVWLSWESLDRMATDWRYSASEDANPPYGRPLCLKNTYSSFHSLDHPF